MTKEERDVIEAKVKEFWRVNEDDDYDLTDLAMAFGRDVERLLAALDEAEEVIAESKQWNNADCNTCPISGWSACEEICASKVSLMGWLSATAADRDRRKAREEALERALKQFAPCQTCDSADDCEKYGKALACTLVCFMPDAWCFDEARFAKGEETNEPHP